MNVELTPPSPPLFRLWNQEHTLASPRSPRLNKALPSSRGTLKWSRELKL